MTSESINNEITFWLEKCLTNLKDITVEILGNSEKGDGFIGDIVFVHVAAKDILTNQPKDLDLVLKCSKKNESLRKNVPVKDAFYNEIVFYDKILPELQQFQKSKQVKKIFDIVPKYYGHFTNETTEILVLENLKKNGFELWDRCVPLTKQHMLMIAEKYGQFHGISVAMQDQEPEKYREIVSKLTDVFKGIANCLHLADISEKIIDEVCEELEGICYKENLEKFLKFKEKLQFVLTDMRDEADIKIICHGDSWNNNFMWKHNKNNKNLPEEVNIIDLQLSCPVSPIIDLSHFIFSCISPEDFVNLDTVLDAYYNSFAKTLIELGSDPEKLYSKNVFLADWKKFSRFGITMSLMLVRLACCNQDNLPEIGKDKEKEEVKDNNRNNSKVDNVEMFRHRMKCLLEYIVENHLID